MKRCLLACIALTLLLGSYVLASISQQKRSSGGPKTDVSLAATVSWIQTTATAHGNCIEKSETGDIGSAKLEQVKIDSCNAKLISSTETVFGSGGFVITHEATVRLADIDYVEIKGMRFFKTSAKDSYWDIRLVTKGDKVIGEVRTRISGQLNRTPFASSSINIPCDDQQVAERLQRAFEHAVSLCAKKKEPF
jgi:hypothetical protein